MNIVDLVERCRRGCAKGLIIAYLVLLGLLTVALYPNSFGATSIVIPWNWNPSTVCVALWILHSPIWAPIAFLLALPIAIFCFAPTRIRWGVVVGAVIGMVLLSATLSSLPYYIESVGEIPTSNISGTIWTHRDFFKERSAGVFVLIPVVLVFLMPRRLSRGGNELSVDVLNT